MFADTDAIRALGSANSAHADDLADIAATLSSLPVAGRVDSRPRRRAVSVRAGGCRRRGIAGSARIERPPRGGTDHRVCRRGCIRRCRPWRRRAHHRGLAVPSALVAALSAPIREVQSLVGPGWSGDPSADPAVALGRARDALANVSAATRHTWDRTNWTGSGADAAADFTASTVAAIDGLAARAGQLSSAAGDASAAVARAHERLRGIVDRFEARAQALEPYLDSPGVAEQLMSEAQRSLDEAVAVVEELRGELDEHATVLAAPNAARPRIRLRLRAWRLPGCLRWARVWPAVPHR